MYRLYSSNIENIYTTTKTTNANITSESMSPLNMIKSTNLVSSQNIPKPNETEWVIYTKAGCPYCSKAMELLKSQNSSAQVTKFEMTSSNKQSVYTLIDSLTSSYRYYPIIFHKGKFVGGFSDLKKYLNK